MLDEFRGFGAHVGGIKNVAGNSSEKCNKSEGKRASGHFPSSNSELWSQGVLRKKPKNSTLKS
jgi:hypothetical protein